jgi:uncharacterized protein YdeI (YjbR/CyaY-like superfamily)
MPEPTKNNLQIISFTTKQEFYDWLASNHDKLPGIWLRMYKKASGQQSITWEEAVEVALCFGWIDSLANRYDDVSHIQKFTPRRPKSIWSQKNCATAERMINEKRMHASGLLQIDAAKTNGRWDAAYASPKNMQVPEDFIELLKKYPDAEAFFQTLNKTNLYSIAFRLSTARKPETREKRVILILQMLIDGKKFH